MWQTKFIEISMRLQSNADGGLFRYLSNVNEMMKIMLSSWLINIYCILFPIFTIAAIFLLVQTIRGWGYLIFPKLRFIIPVMLVACIGCGSVVFVQLSEINEDINKIQTSSDYYANQIVYHISLSINNTKKSFMNTLKSKKYDLFPLVDNIVTDFILIANKSKENRDRFSKFSVDLFGKSDSLIEIFNQGNLYVNSSYEMRKSLTKIIKVCNKDLLRSRVFCKIYKKECDDFFVELEKMDHFFRSRDSTNKKFVLIFGKILPAVYRTLTIFNLSQYLKSPAQFYDDALQRMDIILDQVIRDKVVQVLAENLVKNRSLINEYLQKTQKYIKLVLYTTLALNVVFLLCVTASVILNLVVSKTIKYNRPVVWGVAHFLTYFFGTVMLIIFVTGTSILLNSQTEVCRYLGDISESSVVADGFIDSFMDHHSKYFLAKNVPEKILTIPKLNIKNPRGILTTVIRQCPAKQILLPSLKLYRPINTTAIIYSNFFLNDVLQPNFAKANQTIYDNYGTIVGVSDQVFAAKDHLLELLNFFPRDNQEKLFSFDSLSTSINALNNRRNKFFLDGINERLNFDNHLYDDCFGFLLNATVFKDNEKFLYKLMEPMEYFEFLIRDLVVVMENVKNNMDVDAERYFSKFLHAVLEPIRFYANRLIGILEEETLSRVIPCFELSDFYLEAINGVCNNQLGNVLVLMVFGTLTFTVGNVLLLVIMMSY